MAVAVAWAVAKYFMPRIDVLEGEASKGDSAPRPYCSVAADGFCEATGLSRVNFPRSSSFADFLSRRSEATSDAVSRFKSKDRVARGFGEVLDGRGDAIVVKYIIQDRGVELLANFLIVCEVIAS